jgi:hypothetical protein
MSSALFRYVTTNILGDYGTPNPIISELPFTNVNWTNQLNSNGTFQGEILLSGINSSQQNAYNGTIPGKTILWVLYSDDDTFISVPVWSGVIWAREYDSTTQRLSITAQEMMSLYEKRLIDIDLDYADAFYDPGLIAKELMEYAETGYNCETGLTYDVSPTAYATKQFYYGYELKNVYQAVKDLAAQFFDFKIQPTIDFATQKLVNEFVLDDPLGVTYDATDPDAIIFAFPGNLVAYQFPEDATGAANKLYGLGYGANGTKIIATAIDPSKIYPLSGGDWPSLEATVNFVDIPDIQLVKDLTLGQLNAISYPPTTVQVIIPPYVDPIYPSYKVGDQVRLSIQDDYFPNYLNTIMRIAAISVDPGEDGPARITVTLTRLLAAGTVT